MQRPVGMFLPYPLFPSSIRGPLRGSEISRRCSHGTWKEAGKKEGETMSRKGLFWILASLFSPLVSEAPPKSLRQNPQMSPLLSNFVRGPEGASWEEHLIGSATLLFAFGKISTPRKKLKKKDGSPYGMFPPLSFQLEDFRCIFDTEETAPFFCLTPARGQKVRILNVRKKTFKKGTIDKNLKLCCS